MPIYTRSGDSGKTSLFGGKRVLKCEELVDVYGSLDELNSWVGYVISHMDTTEVRKFLEQVQKDLFALGGSLAGWKSDLAFTEKRTREMEARIDELEKNLPELSNFILPGGSPLGSVMHITRAICRRVERQTVALAQTQTIDPGILQYLNRLSDLFFMLARFINKNEQIGEVPWSGISRKT